MYRSVRDSTLELGTTGGSAVLHENKYQESAVIKKPGA